MRNFLAGSALYWVERFGVDGLRVDAVASMLYRDYSREPGEWVPNVHGGRENLEAISLLQRVNEILGAEAPGSITLAEESTAFPKVSAPTWAGGLGFHYKWNMGWMHDKMPGDEWQRFANLRAYYTYMWAHPGKKLLFMGQEFAQPSEWNHETELPWGLLADPKHAGVHALLRDLNRLYRERPALHQLDTDPAGFEWIDAEDADHSIYAWLRRDAQGQTVLVVCNLTPVPREGWRLGVPDRPGSPNAWREALNSDSSHYGGSNLGNGATRLAVQAVPAQGRAKSIVLTLPPLATLYLTPDA